MCKFVLLVLQLLRLEVLLLQRVLILQVSTAFSRPQVLLLEVLLLQVLVLLEVLPDVLQAVSTDSVDSSAGFF